MFRRIAVLAVLIVPVLGLSAQAPAAAPEDVRSIDGIITALYATISGPVGKPRQWDRFYSLFHPEARLVPTRCMGAAPCTLRAVTPAQYRQGSDSALMALGFHEKELVRREERFGAIAHAFSSYESYRRDETAPFSRGINSIQLFWDGSRWWILSVYWDGERPNNP